MDIFGIPTQALFGQLLIGLINGSFYALLSLGLAVIFGLLNIINFTHGAQYMLGAFVAYLLLNRFGIGYWWALLIAPIVVGAIGMVIERLMLSQLYKLDHLYGLLLTFGLALIIEGLFRNEYGSSGQPYPIPAHLRGGQNLGFMFLPKYRAWVIVASLIVCLSTWYVIERTKLGSYLRAATENPTARAGVRHQRAAHDHADLRLRRRAGGARRRDGRADLPGQSADGGQSDHRGVRGGRDRRHGLDPGCGRHRVRSRPRRGPDQGLLSGGFEHGDLRDHGDRAADQAGGSLRNAEIGSTWRSEHLPPPARPGEARGFAGAAPAVPTPAAGGFGAHARRVRPDARVLVLPPLFAYPVFLMKVLCFALFACAFNLLIGFGGLLSFGHAMFLGTAGYVAAHTAKVWGLSPEIAILLATAASLVLGWLAGLLAIRRQGIYFAMITLALAQMVYFFYLQAPFTGGEDGIQAVPRGKLFGLFDLSQAMTMYWFVLAIFLAAFLLIWRIVQSPFGQVLKAIRENEARATSLGFDTDRFKLLAFVLSAGLSGLAGATKAIVFQLASLTDVYWSMSGEVVLMTLVGGMGTVFGPVVGAGIIITMQNYLAQLGAWVTVVQGVIFVICVLAFRRGVIGEIANWLKKPL